MKMTKTPKSNEISSLSEMLDDVSINELSEYLKNLKEFEKTVDSLIEERSVGRAPNLHQKNESKKVA